VENTMRRTWVVLSLAVLAMLAAAAGRSTQGDHSASEVQISYYRLPNGLRVVLAPDQQAKEVALNLAVDAGSRRDPRNRAGLAKLVQLLFVSSLESQEPGSPSYQGNVNQERASFSVTLPQEQVGPAISRLAESLRGLHLDGHKLASQKAALESERKREAQKSYQDAAELVNRLVFVSFNYGHSVNGSEASIEAASLPDATNFLRRYYSPANSAVTIVGKFDAKHIREILSKHFAIWPSGMDRPSKEVTTRIKKHRETVYEAGAKGQQYLVAYRTVPSHHADWYTLNLLADILGQGEESRLQTGLIRPKIAEEAVEGMTESPVLSLLLIKATASQDGDISAVERIINRELERIASEGVSEPELTRAKSQEQNYRTERMRSLEARVSDLSRFALYYDDPHRLNTELPRMQKASRKDVQRVAQRYLAPKNRVVVVTLPAR
jgi:zinc protease